MELTKREPTPVIRPCMCCGVETSSGQSGPFGARNPATTTKIDQHLERLRDRLFRAVKLPPPRPFSLTLCPLCVRVRYEKQIIAVAAWTGFLAMFLAALITGRWGLWGMIAFLLFFLGVFVTAASSVRFKNRPKEPYPPRA